MRRITVSGNQHTDLAERRFTKKNPCPICGGGHDTERGIGERCAGFLSEDERCAFCTRKGGGLELIENMEPAAYAHRLDGDCRCGLPHGAHLNGHGPGQTSGATSRDVRSRATKADGLVVATYDYVDEEGTQLFQVVRYEPKDFRQRHKVKGKWAWNLKGVRRVLYRLPEVIAAVERQDEVWIAEGEKDVDRLKGEGVVATCNPMGAGKWDDAYAQFFDQADVVVVRDTGSAGATHARKIRRSLVGVARSVRVYEALTGTDVSEHLDAGHTLDQLVSVDRFVPVDLGAAIRDGIDPPAFLIEGVHYAGRAHAIAGAPGDGKTLLELALCAELVKRGETVAWFDEENGPQVIASRLESLSVTADEATERFFYYPFSEPTLDDAEELVAEMAALSPCLVVFDSGADMYEASQLNEDNNMDMTRWARAFSQRLSREYSIATVVLEHVAKNSDGQYQRGAGAKKAKVDALFMLVVQTAFDHETVGEVELVRAKDRLAHLPPRLRYRIGGDAKGKTIFERVEVEDVEQQRAAQEKQKRDAFGAAVVKVLRREKAFSKETGLTQNQLTSMLSPGAQGTKAQIVQDLAQDPRTKLRVAPGARASLIYWLERKENATDSD